MDDIDVTQQVSFGRNDGDALPMTKCICGLEFATDWGFVLWNDRASKRKCPECGRSFYFRNDIRVFQVFD